MFGVNICREVFIALTVTYRMSVAVVKSSNIIITSPVSLLLRVCLCVCVDWRAEPCQRAEERKERNRKS